MPGLPQNRFIIDEDMALKQKLSNQTVVNYANGATKPIAVYFRFPDSEERNRTFPHVAIDLVDIQFDRTRAHRAAMDIIPFDLEQATPPAGQFLISGDMPLPWTLVYQLSAYSRQPWDDRQLTAMLYQMFPEQFGWLDCSNLDGTIRRADLISVVRRDTIDEQKKRLYRNIFTIGVSSEFYVYQIAYINKVRQINATIEVVINQAAGGTPEITETVVVS